MKELKPVTEICDQILKDIGADFVGLALQNENGPDVKWHYAAGNLNDKYKRITVRFGKGIAGRVISTGSEMMIAEFPHGIIGKVTDYPITLAENLVSMYAAPLFLQTIPKGVLLVGKRIKYFFSEEEQEYVQESAQELELILTENILS
jgi:nitrogen regulatory protein A